jgi:hypothetical protein
MNVSLSPGLLVDFTIAGLVFLYFLPSIVAAWRLHRHKGAIFVLNLLLGLTVLGWVGALVWACMNCQPLFFTETEIDAVQPTETDRVTFASMAPSRRQRRVPAALSPAQRRTLVEIER